MPSEARVFIAEDDGGWQKLIRRSLKQAGHNVIGSAVTIEEALAAVQTFDNLQIQVVTIDGNLSPDDISGNDGRALLAAIRQYAPNVKTVGLSGTSVKGVDQDLRKANIKNLGKIVTKF